MNQDEDPKPHNAAWTMRNYLFKKAITASPVTYAIRLDTQMNSFPFGEISRHPEILSGHGANTGMKDWSFGPAAPSCA